MTATIYMEPHDKHPMIVELEVEDGIINYDNDVVLTGPSGRLPVNLEEVDRIVLRAS